MVRYLAYYIYNCKFRNAGFCAATIHQHLRDARPTIDMNTTVSNFLFLQGKMPSYSDFVKSADNAPHLEWRRHVTHEVYRAMLDLDPSSFISEFFNPLLMTVMNGYLHSAANPARQRV